MIVTRTYLELRRGHDVGAAATDGEIGLAHARDITPAEYRALYTAVGSAYRWFDRNAWSDERLAAHLADPRVAVYVARVEGDVAGYAELVHSEDGDESELAYFGLMPRFHGRGLGRALLEAVIAIAWRGGAQRLWLHTCTLDAPAALPNYLARGFRPFREEQYEIPD